MKNIKLLSNQEMRLINAGESGWYWVVYAVGQVYHYAKESYKMAYEGGGNHYHSAG